MTNLLIWASLQFPLKLEDILGLIHPKQNNLIFRQFIFQKLVNMR